MMGRNAMSLEFMINSEGDTSRKGYNKKLVINLVIKFLD